MAIPPLGVRVHERASFSRISDEAVGLSLSAELKAAVAINGHEEQLFRWVGCRKTPALLCLRADPNPIAQFAQRLFPG